MYELEHFVGDRWQPGQADPLGIEIVDPVRGAAYATLRQPGGLTDTAMCFGRRYGGASFGKLSFAVRGAFLARLGQITHARRDDLIAFARDHLGQTKADAVFDIAGAIAVLNYYAALATQPSFGERTTVLDGGIIPVGDTSLFVGQGRYMSRPGVCLALDAYNFPCWLMAAKAAQAILAGMPVVVVAGQATAALAERLAHYWVNEGDLSSDQNAGSRQGRGNSPIFLSRGLWYVLNIMPDIFEHLPDENKKRFVAILNKKVEIGRLLNALGHMTAGLAGGGRVTGEEMCFLEYRDKDGGVHPTMSHYPFIVLQADNSNQIRIVRNEAMRRGTPFVDFADTMIRNLSRTGRTHCPNTRDPARILWNLSFWQHR